MRLKVLALVLFVVATSVMTSGCAAGINAVSIKPIIHEKNDVARIYFVRKSSPYGASVNYNISLDGRTVGNSYAGTYFVIDVEPGHHTVHATTEVTKSLEIDVEPDKDYYVQSYATIGILMARPGLKLLTEEKAKHAIKSLKYIRPTGAVTINRYKSDFKNDAEKLEYFEAIKTDILTVLETEKNSKNIQEYNNQLKEIEQIVDSLRK